MMMADQTSSEYWLSSEDPSVGDFDLNFDGPSMDIDDLLSIIEEKSDPPTEQVKFTTQNCELLSMILLVNSFWFG